MRSREARNHMAAEKRTNFQRRGGSTIAWTRRKTPRTTVAENDPQMAKPETWCKAPSMVYIQPRSR
jgi:hypothetical protein